ncbi:MAG TPA: hypothetical protein VF854_03095 [Azonexus sp.]
MITLLAAARSTMSSQLHTMGSAIGHGVMEKGMGLKAEKPVRVIRLAMLAGFLITTLTAYYLPSFFKDGATIIANGASLFFGLCAGSFLAIYALGLFWKGVTKAGGTPVSSVAWRSASLSSFSSLRKSPNCWGCAKPCSMFRRSARERRSRMSIRSFSRCRSLCSLRWLSVFSRRSRLPGIWRRAFPTGNWRRTICPYCIAYLQSMQSARYAGFILVPHCLNAVFIDDPCTGKRNSSKSSARTWRRCRSNA